MYRHARARENERLAKMETDEKTRVEVEEWAKRKMAEDEELESKQAKKRKKRQKQKEAKMMKRKGAFKNDVEEAGEGKWGEKKSAEAEEDEFAYVAGEAERAMSVR